MKRYNRFVMVFLLICGAASLLFAGQGTDIPKAQLPILTTSAGQSPDVTTLNIIMEEAGIKFDYCDVPTPDIMKTGTGLGGQESGEGFHAEVYTDMEQFPQGTPYKTIIFAIGASLKGMGASGLTVDSEA
ncbi:MAG: hypothetical protein KJ727_01335, partial [Acidobacteria bacterium]|nr:hypothetical protein [Acidobacteriota bacterium]